MTTTPLGLPPVTLDLIAIGVNEADAQAHTTTTPRPVSDNPGARKLISRIGYSSAALSFAAAILLTVAPDSPEVALGALVLSAAGLLGIVTAGVLALAEARRRRRNAKAARDYEASVITILTSQDKLSALPSISGHEHYPAVTEMLKDIEGARITLIQGAGKTQSPAFGGPEHLAALKAVGNYARAQDPSPEQYEAASDAVSAFIAIADTATRQEQNR